MDDGKIIALFFARDEGAVAALDAKYGALCANVAGNLLTDPRDVQECVNDAYLGVWNTIPPQNPDPLRSYLLRIVRNQAAKRYHTNTAQKRNPAYTLALEELEHCIPTASTEDQFDARETARSIDRFLAALEPQSRALFILRYYHGMAPDALAARFHIRPHAVSVRLYRLRQQLKTHLLKEGISL